ncbi:MAG: hypothetical protein C0410_11635 [Anaerolinea sp.]|nr:hypothetical protein [Anaerolinea sp.]
MATDRIRILVFGAGVNGSACATILHQSGIDVTVLARGSRFEFIRDNGIVIENPLNNKRTIVKVNVVNSLAPNGFYDYIFVIMRKNQALEIVPILKQNCSPNIVFMGNTLADPHEYTNELGKERVLMGHVYAAGRREGDIIKAMIVKSVAIPFGEIDGSITPRLEKLVTALNQGISKAKISTHIVDDLVIHAAGVIPIAMLGLKHGGDLRALAKSKADLILLVNAVKESLSVVQALGYRHLSPTDHIMKNAPQFILTGMFRLLFKSKMGEVGISYHLSQASDEMLHLANEMNALVEKSGLEVSSLRKALDILLTKPFQRTGFEGQF